MEGRVSSVKQTAECLDSSYKGIIILSLLVVGQAVSLSCIIFQPGMLIFLNSVVN